MQPGVANRSHARLCAVQMGVAFVVKFDILDAFAIAAKRPRPPLISLTLFVCCFCLGLPYEILIR